MRDDLVRRLVQQRHDFCDRRTVLDIEPLQFYRRKRWGHSAGKPGGVEQLWLILSAGGTSNLGTLFPPPGCTTAHQTRWQRHDHRLV